MRRRPANFTLRRLRLEATICTQNFDTQTFPTTQRQMTEKRGGVVCVGSLNIDLFCYLHDQFPKPGKSRPPHPCLRVLPRCVSDLLSFAASQQVMYY